jgi:DNA-directed RNA polymerase subunit RPC12/RpoP
MDYNCQHCGSNLDDGDIFEYFLLKYNDHAKALQTAKLYGWSENNKKHFNRATIVQSETEEQYTECPDCKKKI